MATSSSVASRNCPWLAASRGRAIIALSWRRWAVETHYRDETTFQPIERLHSRTPDGLRQALFASLVAWVIARVLTALSVLSEARETARSLVPPRLKNAWLTFARDAALVMPAPLPHALIILQELLNAIRQVQYHKPRSSRPPCPRLNKSPGKKWQDERPRKLTHIASVSSIGGWWRLRRRDSPAGRHRRTWLAS